MTSSLNSSLRIKKYNCDIYNENKVLTYRGNNDDWSTVNFNWTVKYTYHDCVTWVHVQYTISYCCAILQQWVIAVIINISGGNLFWVIHPHMCLFGCYYSVSCVTTINIPCVFYVYFFTDKKYLNSRYKCMLKYFFENILNCNYLSFIYI